MKPVLVRRLLLATFIASFYNILTYFFIQIRSVEPDFKDLSFWANFPQIGLTVLIYYSWRDNYFHPNFKRFFTFLVMLWILINFLNTMGWYGYFIEQGQKWPFISSVFQGLGFQVEESSAPLAGLFHSPWLDERDNIVWEFDGGIGLSWWIFQILSVLLILVLSKLAINQRIDVGNQIIVKKDEKEAIDNLDNNVQLEGPLSSLQRVTAASTCHHCDHSLSEGQKFCANCGEPVKPPQTTPAESEEVECDKCGAELVKNQKFCGGCGIEIQWSSNHDATLEELTFSEKTKSVFIGKNEILGAAAVIGGILFLALMFWPTEPNRQEECFDKEMLKFGAYADPKGWAIKSRLYCQSLYP